MLFLGYAVSRSSANILSGASVAGNNMQVDMLTELLFHSDVQLEAVTVYPIAPFPREKRIFVNKKMIRITDKLSAQRISFLNIPIIKQMWQIISVYYTAKKIIDKDTIIFTFNMFPQVGVPAVWLKRKYGCKLCSLLADLPIDDFSESNKKIRKFLRRKFEDITRRAIKKCDGLIVLNQNAIPQFSPGTPHIIVEGGISCNEIVPLVMKNKTKKNIVYSGALTSYSGINELIAAMGILTHKDVVLDIYGGGYLQEKIKTIAKKETNINYYGKVSHETILDIQREAYLLVNPRPIEDPIAMVTFPSKMFEYMTSGTPVLTTKLSGLTNDFLKYVFVTDNDKAEDIAVKIDEILDLPLDNLQSIAREAYEFIVKQKNWEEQSIKIYHFLKNLNKLISDAERENIVSN